MSGNGRLRVGIEGGAGFIGGELLRLLLGHPKVEVASISSGTYPGRPVFAAHPNLRGRTDLRFSPALRYEALDCLFLAGGPGEAMSSVPSILARAGARLRLVDLSGDFRLMDSGLYPKWYGREHASPGLLHSFAYGLPELNRPAIRRSRRIANPGCFATAMALALGPLAKGRVSGSVSVTAVTGSSGSGAVPSSVTHHPTRHSNMRAYKPLSHQHVPEVDQLLRKLAGGKAPAISMVPLSGPFSRGIYAVCQAEVSKTWTAKAVKALFQTAYKDCRFIRLVDEPPSLNAVNGSNHCDIYATALEGRLCVISALDNLVKGASGQAVQNLNVMMGWREDAGLDFAGCFP